MLNRQNIVSGGAPRREPGRHRGAVHRMLTVTAASVVALAGLTLGPVGSADASSVTSATFTGGAGTATSGGVLYARSGGSVTLTVVTSSETRCVDISGALTSHQTSAAARSSWTFTYTAGTGDGTKAVTAAASPNFNQNNGQCTGQTGTAQASYALDNTGPVVTGVATPAPNAAGWNRSNVSIAWSAADVGGSGVASGPIPATDSQQQTTTGAVKTASATDRVGNSGSGSVTVRLDKDAPVITGSASPAPNANGWNNSDVTATFSCDDNVSGVKTCPPSTTLSASGSAQSASGTAVDNADNSASTTVGGINIDKVAPSLSGAATTAPNGNGWYNGVVTIAWTASDSLSGLAGPSPADSPITVEGLGLRVPATVTDRAGNSTTAKSAAVDIDRTAPTTAVTGASNDWTAGDVTVDLVASDNLSGVASTSFTVDGGSVQTGTTVTLSAEGDHTVTYRSTDRAGNVEPAGTAHVRIDRTAPTITHHFTPADYEDAAWTNHAVTVTFSCADAGSGVASCTAPVTESTEGEFTVNGSGTDNAGNLATDSAGVRIDTTRPTITAGADRAPNGAGWYDDDVIVSYPASDTRSGLASNPDSTRLGQGADQTATGTAVDRAGNSASATIGGINVDKTAPELTGSYTSGWHTGDVTVHWSCTDPLSGVVSAPSDDTVSGEGGNLSSSATCLDAAGNQAASTVHGIAIDRTAPTTTATVPDPLPSGWYGGPVEVTLTGHDSLSGVGRTLYTIDDGPTNEYTNPFVLATKGSHTVTYWSEDAAGNVEDRSLNSLPIDIDGKAPTTTVINPISPASGWFVDSGIPVAFDASDAESGVAATYYRIDGGDSQTYGEPFTANLSTGHHSITFWSVDLAGNVEDHQTTPVDVDTIAPTITAARTPVANSHGWNNTPVDVSFQCSDADSGVDGVIGCGPDTTVSAEGPDQQVRGDAFDVAGNHSSTVVGPINIDTTRPTLTGAATADANGAGWYHGDVEVAWTGRDGLSGIDASTQPPDSIVSGEGRNLGASASIVDRAGNEGTGTIGGLNIDRTAPTITGVLPAGQNAAGWYRGDVVVGFSCADPALADASAGSGVAACPSDAVISGDGAGQTATSGPAKDQAGNVRSGTTVGGINIDGHEPQTTADNRCTATNGYCTGDTATVVLSATDVGPSGVKEIHSSVNGGPDSVSTGTTRTLSVPLSGTGSATVRYYAVDGAGNTEPANQVVLKYDNIAPTVTHTVSPSANAADWNNSNVTVHFDAADTDPGSGVQAGSVTPDVVVGDETTRGGRVVTGTAKDTAGNTGSDSVTVRLDKTAPGISGSIVSGTLGNNGWYVGPVAVRFTCSDALSGIAVCPDGDVLVTTNGANQSAAGKARDVADNESTATVTGINIDNESPSITDVNVASGFYLLGAAPTASCTAGDGVSGLQSCKVVVTGGAANGVGTFSWTATATDRAGNTSSRSGTYRVVYRFDGFLQPINDTAHQVDSTTSIFKAGSTVPVKFQLKTASGTVVQAGSAPVWTTPAKGNAMSLPVDESLFSATADSGSSYRYDATAQQYIYNWKTGAGGSYWRIQVRLDDGQTYSVTIGLR